MRTTTVTIGVWCLALSGALALGADEHGKDSRATEVRERLRNAETSLREVMAVPEKEIPRDLIEKAQCAVIIPGMKQGAFIVGAKYGKGFITCRGRNDRGWSAPANVRLEGGSVGFQIGGAETDVFLLVMNQAGEKILNSEFKIGAEAAAMAGPVGRQAQANTDAYMRAKILGWSRARGAFAGIALEGSTLREDKDDNRALYGRALTNKEIVQGKMTMPAEAGALVKTLTSFSAVEKH